jgi:hypothetical protein
MKLFDDAATGELRPIASILGPLRSFAPPSGSPAVSPSGTSTG